MNDKSKQQARILITARSVANSPAALDLMRQAGHEVIIETTPSPIDPQWLADKARDVDALVFAMEPIQASLLDNATRLKLIARPGVGYDTVDLACATRNGIIVTVAAGTNDQTVADFTFALMLEAMRGASISAADVKKGGWERFTGADLWRKKIAIVGLGRIGKGVVRRAKGFEMEVMVVARTPDLEFGQQHGIRFVSFDEALAQADILSLHAPLTPQTENLIDAAALAKMKRGAYLINTSRGGLVDEHALADAVRRGHLAGAAVDVLREQGAGSRSHLIGVPGIIVTPHIATFTRESTERVAMSVARSVLAVLDGKRPEHVVNPEVFLHPEASLLN